MSAAHRFNNALRYRDDYHEMQRQLTPPYVLEPVRRALGTIELDPCTEPDNPTGAQRFFTASHDGAAQPWDASAIYVNPPYSKAREKWVGRCIEAAAAGARVILLMPSHTDTRLFHRALDTASHVVFIRGRVKFGVLRNNGRQEAASHPSCLICWNLESADELAHLGRVWDLTAAPAAHATASKDAEIEALRAEVERLTFELGCLRQHYDERTACMIVHRGAALACSAAVRAAYSDEHHRAERLAEALRNSADALERLAFAIRAPNAHTPQLVRLAIAMRNAAIQRTDAALDQEAGRG